MAIVESFGYAGTVNALQFAIGNPNVGRSDYGVRDLASWAVTASGSGDRAVSVAPGDGWGHSVYDINNAAVVLNLPAVSSGQRWFLIVARRVWGTKTTSFEAVIGSDSKSIPTRATSPGTLDEQPLALVRVVAGSGSIAEIIDLRVVPGNGGVEAFDELALSYLDRVGSFVGIGEAIWRRRRNSLGTPEWQNIMGSGPEFEVPIGIGWLRVNGHPLTVRAVGADAVLEGMLRAGAGASFDNMMSVPSSMWPAVQQIMDAKVSSSGAVYSLSVLPGPTGAVYSDSQFRTQPSPIPGHVYPVTGRWRRR